MASLAVDKPIFEDLISDETVDFDRLLSQLNQAQKQCIELFYFEKKSYKEIAELNGFDLKQVKSHIQNGKKRLKKIILNEVKSL